MKRTLELLAPAADREVAIQAILHGADAVYMGGPSHGARRKASNSLEDIAEVVAFAHRFRARVYITVNTLVYESELQDVQNLCRDLYRIGVDALIVQDMALLRMDIPPIALHASTQCDTRTPEKAEFLQQVGFSQIVLARELSIAEIGDVCRRVSVPVECFVHGALCVSYSGRCGASFMATGRSANRGECSQMCRMPYTLRNARGEVLEKDKYLLSLRDFNASRSIPDLIEAGVSSFKIEGRLKDAAYVKNITAYYRAEIDRVIAAHPDLYERSSYGESRVTFTPDPAKSFNRGFTDYFLGGRRRVSMASLRTPKSLGEEIDDVRMLNNGDGISFFNSRGEYEGIGVNRIDKGRIIGSRPFTLPKGTVIHRTLDRRWQNELARDTAERTVAVDITIDEMGITAIDERGVQVRIALDAEKSEARKPMDPRPIFAKLGGTTYHLRNFKNLLSKSTFIPASQLTALRRRLVEELDSANLTTYRYDYRRKEHGVYYVAAELDARDNVANSLAERFYREHGVKKIASALEASGRTSASASSGDACASSGAACASSGAACASSGAACASSGVARPTSSLVTNTSDLPTPVMTTRYCIRRELGVCLCDRNVDPRRRDRFAGPLTISTGPHTFRLDFDCKNCEMNLYLKK